MINPELLTYDLAKQVAKEAIDTHIVSSAEEFICSCCACIAVDIYAKRMAYIVKEALDIPMVTVEELRHQAYFEKLFKLLLPYERKYKALLASVWEKEEKIILANLKKMKKAWLSKDKIDDLLYPQAQFEKELSENALKIDVAIIDAQGNAEMATIAATDVVFDVANPEVQKWLKSYTPKFAKGFEETSVKRLRNALSLGIEAGEGVPELAKRIREVFVNWSKQRSIDVAQGETLRASNKASLEAYRQSGVVKKKVWITHLDDKTCGHCRRLNGKVISLEKNFFSIGDSSTVTMMQNGKKKKNTLKITYENVDGGNLHNKCRCTVAAHFEEA